MQNFYENLPYEDAEQLQQLSQMVYDFRISRSKLLEQYDVADEAALLEKIRTGIVSEHPAYDHYLSARILDEMREIIRAELKDFLPKVKPE